MTDLERRAEFADLVEVPASFFRRLALAHGSVKARSWPKRSPESIDDPPQLTAAGAEPLACIRGALPNNFNAVPVSP
jgi:hypothetical protein